jgi:hypothetical protein
VKERIYSRLTARKRTLFGYTQLWLGPNHLLLVKSTHFVEEYRRFAFQDIQAIIITGLPKRTVIQIASLIAAMIWTVGLFAVDSAVAKAAFVFTGLAALTVVVVDIARGQRCRCHLQTAVSLELLAPVSRLSQANRLLAQLQPVIEAVQGPFTAEHIVDADVDVPGPPPEVLISNGHAPEMLFVLLLLDAALAWADQRFPRVQAGNLLLTTLLAEVVLALVVLVRRGPYTRPLVHFLAISALLCIAWDSIGILRSLGTSVAQVMDSVRHGNLVPFNFSWSPSRVGILFAITWRSVLGVTGLTATYFERHRESSR